MQTKIIIILSYILVGLLGLYGILKFFIVPENNEIKMLQTQIEQLQTKNDSLQLDNKLLDSLIITQRSLADSLSKEVQITNRVIKKLKNVRYERIRAIDSMGNNELIEFFSKFEPTGTDN